MRQLTAVIGMGVLVALAAGCSSTRLGWLKTESASPNAPANPGPPGAKVPTVASLVDYLNDNAGRVRTVRVDDMSVHVSNGGIPITLSGRLVAEKPRGFRMGLDGPLGARHVDLGSNSDEFWFWASKINPPSQYYCSYKDFEEGRARLNIPFQPQWIMETIGMGPYGPVDRYEIQYDKDTVRLVERTKAPSGQPVRKEIVMRRRETRAPEPQVTHYLLIDDTTNKEICSAHITETTVDRVSGAIVPRRVQLYWPQEQLKLGMELRGMSINPQLPPEAFVRRKMDGVPSANIAQIGGDPSIQRAQGTMPK